jgi:hypothetical protein
VPQLAVAVAMAIGAFLASAPAVAQTSPPSLRGSHVIDIRAPMSRLPAASAFHPVLPANALVPKRGFGLGFGGHIYVADLGVATIGVGVDVLRVRGTAATPATTGTTITASSTNATPASALSTVDTISVATAMTAISPQVSFNFGTREGWSYLSGGYGVGEVRTAATGTPVAPLAGTVTLVRDDGRAAAINYGGGARWFIRDRVAVGFDLRFHRLGGIGTRPPTTLSVVSIGVSVR